MKARILNAIFLLTLMLSPIIALSLFSSLLRFANEYFPHLPATGAQLICFLGAIFVTYVGIMLARDNAS